MSQPFGAKLTKERPEPRQCSVCNKMLQPLPAGNYWTPQRCDCEKQASQKQTPRTSERSRLRIVRPNHNPGGMSNVSDLLVTSTYRSQPKPEPHVCTFCRARIDSYELPNGSWKEQLCQCERSVREYYNTLTSQWYDYLRQRSRCYGGWLGGRWKDHEVIAEMMAMTFDNWNIENFPEQYAAAWEFANNPEGNLILCSKSFGTGKTHIAGAISNYLAQVGRLVTETLYDDKGNAYEQTRRELVSSTYATLPQFFDAYYSAMYSKDNKDSHEDIMDKAIRIGLLILDEVEGTDEKRREVLYTILDTRYRKHRPTIILSNQEDKLVETLGGRIYSRISRGIQVLEFEGTDYRLFQDPESEESQSQRRMRKQYVKALQSLELMDALREKERR